MKRHLTLHSSLPSARPSFYLNALHLDFNFDTEEATEAVNRFEVHMKAVDAVSSGFTQSLSSLSAGPASPGR